MKKQSIKPFLVECGLILEVSDDWKRDFLTGAKGMPKTDENVLNFIGHIYSKAFGGEQNIAVINKKMAKWLVEQVHNFGGVVNIGTEDIEKLVTVMTWFKFAGSEGNLPKMDLNTAFDFSSKKIEEKEKKENLQKNANEFSEPPISKVEEEGLVKRVYTIPDGSGRFWVKVDPSRAGEFFDRLCDLNKAHGVGCQSIHSGMMHDQHRKMTRTSYTLLGQEKGSKGPVTTLMAISVEASTKNIVESKQVGNQPVGTNLYGWDDLFEKFVEFLATPVGVNTIAKTTDSYAFSWAFANQKFDAINRLDAIRPDFIEASKNAIISSAGGKEWFETRAIDAVEALKKFGGKKFIENIETYTKSNSFKDALQELSALIPLISKENPDLVLSKINYLLDFLSIDDFKNLFEHVNLQNYIRNNKEDFEKLLKKLSNVNSKDAKSYKSIFKSILDNYFPVISETFGGGTIGVSKIMNFLEMPKSDKHKFIKRTSEGKIIAQKKEVKVNVDGTRTESDVDFELSDQLSLLPQKERRDLLKKNEEFIKSKIDGDSDRKDINFLRLLFKESNSQEIQRSLKAEKERFIRYYDDPAHITKYNVIRGVHLPGIFEFYRLFNRGNIGKTAKEGAAEKPYFKFDLEDIRDPQVAKTIINFFAKLYKVDYPELYSAESPDMLYTILEDYSIMLELSGESEEKIEEFIKKYKPTSLKIFKGNNSNISLSVYKKYYDFLSRFTSKEKSKNDITINKEEIVSRIGFGEYEKLLNVFSYFEYDVEVADMLEFIGNERKSEEKKSRPDEEKLKKYYALDSGRKYSITQVDPIEIDGVKNALIKVIDNTRRETEWLSTKEFKVDKKILREANIRNTIRKKLFESYFKNKK